MLDQNTDRMWYVIGAVLIGAAIILGANTLFPNAFASVSESFDDMSSSVVGVVDRLGASDSEYEELFEVYGGVNLAQNTDGELTSGGADRQLYYDVDKSAIAQMRGEWLTASFKIKSPDGGGGYAWNALVRTDVSGVYYDSRSEAIPITNEWTYHEYSFRLSDSMYDSIMSYSNRPLQAGVKSNNTVTGNDGVRYRVTVSEYKLELGKDATSYR